MARPASPVFYLFVVAITFVAAACSDAPSDPDTNDRVPAQLQISAGDGQTADAGQDVPVAPAVLVTNAAGDPLAGVNVSFAVVEGGGNVEMAGSPTDADGVATAGSWILGSSPGENALEATVEGLSAVRFTATSASPYAIVVRYIGSVSEQRKAVVEAAVARWRSIITHDIENVQMNAPASECFTSQPSISEVVDDLLLYVEFANIDGVGDVLGRSGPCYIRSVGDLPIVGYLKMDAADAASMESVGILDDVLLHEIAHVVGFGTIWRDRSLLSGIGTADPRFTGSAAVSAYVSLGGTGNVPVENTGSPGTRESHWRESMFGDELMTGYISARGNPLSALTIASLRDLGYQATSSGAASFALSVSGPSVVGIDLRGREHVGLPTHRVGPRGERRRIEH
jgi:hypothetical protein